MKTIVWDVDDVLNNLMHDWFKNYFLIANPECNLKYENLIENPPFDMLGISLDEYRQSLDEFRFQYGSSFEPNLEILEWFQMHGNKFRHIALTAVPLSLANISAEWVFRHFGNWIRSFHVVPSSRENDPEFFYDRSKKEFLQWFDKGDILIDDNLVNIKGGNDLRMQTIIVPRPWNKENNDLINSLLSILY